MGRGQVLDTLLFIFKGQDLDRISRSDVVILLGAGQCEDILLTQTNLIECFPPRKRPSGGERSAGNILTILVCINCTLPNIN